MRSSVRCGEHLTTIDDPRHCLHCVRPQFEERVAHEVDEGTRNQLPQHH